MKLIDDKQLAMRNRFGGFYVGHLPKYQRVLFYRIFSKFQEKTPKFLNIKLNYADDDETLFLTKLLSYLSEPKFNTFVAIERNMRFYRETFHNGAGNIYERESFWAAYPDAVFGGKMLVFVECETNIPKTLELKSPPDCSILLFTIRNYDN
jgi:hypothetical protein